MLPHEVFLSHSSQDAEAAERIAVALQRHGVPTFYSPRIIVGAQQWQDEILHALQRCDWFAVLLSPDAIQSMWVRRETAFALSDRRYEDRIVPIRHRTCDLGPLAWLQIYQMVDLCSDFEDGMRSLLRVWGVGWRG